MIKRLRRLAIIISLCGGAPSHAAQWLILTNATLIDGTGAPARQIQSLTIHDGIIVAINKQAQRPAVAHPVRHLDLGARYILPGLIDTHVHVGRFDNARTEAEKILRQAVHGGVTAVRDMGGNGQALQQVAAALAQQELIGPTLVYSALYGGPGVFKDPRMQQWAAGGAPGQVPWAQAIDAHSDLKHVLTASQRFGADGIKLYGNVNAATAMRVVAAARQLELPVWAHATVFPAGPGQLVSAGVRSLSHAPYLIWEALSPTPGDYGARTQAPWQDVPPDHPAIASLLSRMAAQGVALDATLYVFDAMNEFSPEVRAEWAPSAYRWGVAVTALAHRLGVTITTGTDWFEPRPGELPHTHEEMALLVEAAGLSPMAAIIAATRNGANSLGLGASHGTIEVGKVADLLIIDTNPLQDIRNSRQIYRTIKAGTVLQPLATQQEQTQRTEVTNQHHAGQ